jgi:hypothetical protein
MSIIRVDTAGGGGGGTPITVLQNGAPIVPNVQFLDFLNNFQIVNGGGGLAQIRANVPLQNVYWVAKSGFPLPVADGTITRPFDTISNAIATIDATSNWQDSIVIVCAGIYNENITLNGGVNVYFMGGAILDGKITLADGNGTLYPNLVLGDANILGNGGETFHITGNANNYINVLEARCGNNDILIRKQGAGTTQIYSKKFRVHNDANHFITQSNGVLYVNCPDISTDDPTAPDSIASFIRIQNNNTTLFTLEGDQMIYKPTGRLFHITEDADINVRLNYASGQIYLADATGYIKFSGAASSGSIVTRTGLPCIYIDGTPANTPNVRVSNMNFVILFVTGADYFFDAVAPTATLYLNQYIQSNATWNATNTALAGAGTFVLDPTMQTNNP